VQRLHSPDLTRATRSALTAINRPLWWNLISFISSAALTNPSRELPRLRVPAPPISPLPARRGAIERICPRRHERLAAPVTTAIVRQIMHPSAPLALGDDFGGTTTVESAARHVTRDETLPRDIEPHGPPAADARVWLAPRRHGVGEGSLEPGGAHAAECQIATQPPPAPPGHGGSCKRAVAREKAGVGFCDTAPQPCLSSGASRVRPAKFQV